jgi:uncharacterized metal-binding protein YceD (DUF177 family)
MTRQPAMSDFEFSRPLDVYDIPPAGYRITIHPDAVERDRIAARLGLRALSALTATITATPIAGGAYRVSGELAADVTQDCVVTLDPIVSSVSGPIGVTFITQTTDEQDEIEVEPAAEDSEILTGAVIDLGEIAVQQLALLLDPYPRKPGASFAPPDALPEPPERRPSPFSVLAKLKSGRESN